MRYFISSHGCYTNRRKVNLKKVTLLFYARENECIVYNNKFLKAFCRESTDKRKEHKPLFKKRREYFQMEFCREETDKFDSYIYCCNTKERIYDFKNGDLLLSQVVDLVTLHNDTYSDSPIYLSMLTCNVECEGEEEEEYGRKLHRKSSFKHNFYPSKYTNKNRENKTALSKKIRSTIPGLAVSKMQSRHTLKSGNSFLYNGKRIKAIKKDGKWYSNGVELNRKSMTYLPHIEPGASVMYKADLWTVEESDGAYLSIRNVKSRAEERVETRDVVALEY